MASIALLLAGPVLAAELELDEYLQRANAARNRADWESVASQYARVINHPDLPKDGPDRVAAHLEYGRAMGVLCQYGEAEKYLLRAKEFAEKAKISPYQVLYELGAINFAQRKFAEAANFFSLMEREPRDKTSALVLADAFEKYAGALAATGKPEEAEARRRDASRIRESAPKVAPPGTITPYGAQCSRP